MELQMTAPCLLGLEGLVAEELRQMDAREVTAENGQYQQPLCGADPDCAGSLYGGDF